MFQRLLEELKENEHYFSIRKKTETQQRKLSLLTQSPCLLEGMGSLFFPFTKLLFCAFFVLNKNSESTADLASSFHSVWVWVYTVNGSSYKIIKRKNGK